MIVLVEDSPLNQMLLKQALARVLKGKQALTCFAEGEAAISFIKKNQEIIKLVILDGNLSHKYLANKKIDGPDVALHIPLHIPVVVWTDDPSMIDRFNKIFQHKKFAYKAFLDKQISIEQLAEVLKPLSGTLSDSKQLSPNEVREALSPRLAHH
ncbi:response regulator [Legionella sp. km772]|uniref:response regulator n=1 Tax=Legionella sp. km772 TaxID=2498111 RepID=UPI000F8D4785|nr:response regulator [Legionella sp. km772]RUR13267.1 response regulator [Legionella sp. km772]